MKNAVDGRNGASGVAFARSYWVAPGRVLAGCYPGDADGGLAKRKLTGLLDAGVTRVINLMEEREVDRCGRAFVPYEATLAHLAQQRGSEVICERFAIRDVSVPSIAVMSE